MKSPASILFLLPAVLSLYYVIRGSTEKAFLRVYLPSLLGLPFYYECQLPHMPPISAAEAALLPIVVGACVQFLPRWRFSRMDLWVVLFLGSLTASELLRESIFTNAMFTIARGFTSMLFPYLVGRLLIEPKLRIATSKAIVVIILLLTAIGLYEFRMGLNLYAVVGSRILDFVPWTVQLRNGRARIATSFSDAELAGIAFVVAIAFNYWLVYFNKARDYQSNALGTWLSRLERYHIPGLVLLTLLLATQSRGPLLGAGVALAVLQIPRFRNTKRATIVMAVLLIAGGLAAYSYFDHYASGATFGASEQQASASYRRQLVENYKPIVEEGGWLGWGQLSHPSVRGQESIDNQYLQVQLGQGRIGLILFMLIGADTIWRLICCTWRFQRREDIYFAFTLLAAVSSLWVTIGTVYLGEQLPQIAFLLIGWSHSLQESKAAYRSTSLSPNFARFKFKRVFA